MNTFENLKEELNTKVKPENPCASEYRRFLSAENEADLLKVIYENINWCLDHKVLSHEYFSKFNQEIYLKSGIANTGLENTGFCNSGNWNSGYRNSGDRNSGNWNSGDRNSGDSNSGDSNSGDSNSGYRNSGNWNSGDRNSGDSNSGYRNSGAFCTDTNPTMILFDKPTNILVKDWENSNAFNIMYSIETTIWVPSSQMTDLEKENNPKHETTEGFLKTLSMKDAWKNAWHNFTDENKNEFLNLPNFDAIKFEEITGIKVN